MLLMKNPRKQATFLLLLFGACCTLSWASPPQAQTIIESDATYQVSGLKHAAEIRVDTHGVPHIYAKDHYDVFFVQGFNAARDRLWQIDLWRKRGLGQLSSVLGPQYLEQDSAARLFLYRGDMYTEWLAYGNDAKRITQAFTAGINAFIDTTQTQPQLLPPEFALLGYEPGKWQPEDVVRIRSNGLWRNLVNEVWRARQACEGQLELANQWRPLEPDWETKLPSGLDPCAIPQDVLAKYTLAKAPVNFQAPGLSSALGDDLNHSLGSNNWVVSGERTNTGRPILADDPHRGHATPSLRYIAHLNGPGINVIGAGEPALPGISIGHNNRIAFGLTIFPIDQEDLYVYTKTADGYHYAGRSEPFSIVQENLSVRDQGNVAIALKYTRHGPVIAETKTHAFAVRAAWLEAGMAPYFGSIEYMRAQNFRDFIAALNRWGAPSENQVYADVEGNIGYKPAGRFPIRRNWDGLFPVPGDGRYEWQGYFDMDVLPQEFNPQRGFSGTANSMNLPPNYPIDEYRVGFEWSDPWRYQRIWESLKQDNSHSLVDSVQLQRDYHSVLARKILSNLALDEHPAAQVLENWDQQMTADSAAAALWNVWYAQHLVPALGDLLAAKDQKPDGLLDSQTVLTLLNTDNGQKIANHSLAAAYAATQQLLGDDPKTWKWGDLHRIRFTHPLLHLAQGELRQQMQMPSYPRGGNANTTNNTSYRGDSFDVVSGASFRMVLDVGNWDNAYVTNAPGQSGDPRSTYYDNLLKNWATEGSFPLHFSRQAVMDNTAFTIRLVPNS